MNKWHVLFSLAVASLGAWCAYTWFTPRGALVEIVQDGRVVSTLDLSRRHERRMLKLDAPGGGFNTLLIENGAVRVLSADCPGHDCVNMGILRSASAPLVCLPHKLVIRYADDNSE